MVTGLRGTWVQIPLRALQVFLSIKSSSEVVQCLTLLNCVYSCFEKGCPAEKHKSVRDNTERHDGLWLFTVASSSSRVFSAMEGGALNTCLHVLKETKWIVSLKCQPSPPPNPDISD